MKKNIFKILLFTFLLPISTLMASPNLEYRVVYGDKETNFTVLSNKNGALIKFQNNQGRKNEFEISKQNYEFLIEKARSIKGENSKSFCQREFIEMKIDKKTKVGCLSSSTPIARMLRENTNFLSMYF